MKANIFIENTYPHFDVDEKKILTGTKKILKDLLSRTEVFSNSCIVGYDFKSISFDVVFCTNEEIHTINYEYRQKDSPTDVISFALFADSPEAERFVFDDDINLGEIIISLDKTKEQAEMNNHSFGQELFFLISHGIMHLLGFDHLTEKELEFMLDCQAKSMERVDVKICSQ